MKKLFENWRKHLNEDEYRREFVPQPELENEIEELADMRDYLKHLASQGTGRGTLELNIDTKTMTAGTIEGEPVLYVKIDGEDNYYHGDDEMYHDLVKKTKLGSVQGKPIRYDDHEDDSLYEGAVPHSANHIVKKMKKTGKSAMETLKSLTTDLSDEEAKRWLERHKDEMESAKQDLASRE